ncbi:PTS transporter subunit EIIB [Brachyspira sp.]|uniref:PTS transporter subunit EIIB n=1 Tax=Brachyspira sp. TaxID=1977261 RepID=UPI00261D96D0|nr:PTS transporter subunit EIIB [Brachyspira sp.]
MSINSSNKEDVKFIVPLNLLGDRDNILKVNNCATRLRLEVKDADKVNAEEIKKYYPAVQKISDNEIHIIVGTNAKLLAESLKKIISVYDSNSNKAFVILPLLGDKENILKINNCATRLRLEIKDINKVNIEEIKKYYPAVQKISDNEIHIVVGTEANKLANSFKELMDSQSFKSSLLLPLLGGIENILKINNCATRLRLEVKDINKINAEEIKKYYPAVQKISDNEVHIVVGMEAKALADEFRKFAI